MQILVGVYEYGNFFKRDVCMYNHDHVEDTLDGDDNEALTDSSFLCYKHWLSRLMKIFIPGSS